VIRHQPGQALEQSGQPPQPEAVRGTAGGWTLLVIASPTQPAEGAAGGQVAPAERPVFQGLQLELSAHAGRLPHARGPADGGGTELGQAGDSPSRASNIGAGKGRRRARVT